MLPLEWQQQILDSQTKYKIAACGRRAGKSTMVALAARTAFCQNKTVLVIAASGNHIELYDAICNAFNAQAEYQPTFSALNLKISGLDCWIKVVGKNWNSRHADHIIVNGASSLNSFSWNLLLSLDYPSSYLFIDTPPDDKTSDFYKFYVKGITQPDYQSWRIPTTMNTHLSQRALEMLELDMPEEVYRREILAEFVTP